jgi:hypothetical protein
MWKNFTIYVEKLYHNCGKRNSSQCQYKQVVIGEELPPFQRISAVPKMIFQAACRDKSFRHGLLLECCAF